MDYFRNLFKSSKVFNFNVVNRDKWVASQARKLPAGTKILDAGAGSCPYKEFFEHCEYKTQDFVMLTGDQLSGDAYGEIDYVCEISNILVSDSYFDVILCTEVLEHLPEPIKAIKEFARILKNNGKLLLTAPLGSGLHQEPYHFYGGYTQFWYEKFLTESGFTNIKIEENSGSLMACAQESMRFIILSRPFSFAIPVWVSVLWLPVWVLLVPIMGVLAPVASYLLNKYDHDKRFTVGYHITAERLRDDINI